jgi:ABC-type lipoprotein release transport system permease subunit
MLLSLPLGLWGMRELVAALRRNSPAVPDVHADAGVAMFLFGATAAIGIAMGLMPLLLVRHGGIRIALGANSGAVRALVFRQTLGIVAVGILAELPTALALSRLYSSLLFGATAADPTAYLGAGALLLAVASLATYLPARRATRVDPISVLRID